MVQILAKRAVGDCLFQVAVGGRKDANIDLNWLVRSDPRDLALQAEQLGDIVTGWDLEDKFSAEAIADLVRTCTGAPKAVIDAYQAAYSPARLGN